MQYAKLFSPFASFFQSHRQSNGPYPHLGKAVSYLEGTPEYCRAVRAAINKPVEGELGIRYRDELVELRDRLRRIPSKGFQRDLLVMFEDILEKTAGFAGADALAFQ